MIPSENGLSAEYSSEDILKLINIAIILFIYNTIDSAWIEKKLEGWFKKAIQALTVGQLNFFQKQITYIE